MELTTGTNTCMIWRHGCTKSGVMKNELRLLSHEDIKTQSTPNVFESFNW